MKRDAAFKQPYVAPKPNSCEDFKSDTDDAVHVQVTQYGKTTNRWWITAWNGEDQVSFGFCTTQKLANVLARRLVLEIVKENRGSR